MSLCEVHNKEPAQRYEDDPECHGELFICQGCHRLVCAAYGAADGLPDHCDSCWFKQNRMEPNTPKKQDRVTSAHKP